MSHFSCMLILPPSPAMPDDETIATTLAPFHEYECTGRDDQYVIDVDVTDKVQAYLDEDDELVKLPDGTYKSRWDNFFYTGPSEPGAMFARPTFQLPAGAEILTMKRRDGLPLLGQTEQQAGCDYGNYDFRDGRYFDHTNPNAKWDWYQVGGWFTGKWAVKQGAVCDVGDPSLVSKRRAGPNRADIVRVGDIDVGAMHATADEANGPEWDDVTRVINGRSFTSWADFIKRVEAKEITVQEARDLYHGQSVIADLNKSDRSFYFEPTDFLCSRDEYLARGRRAAMTPFALIHDGKWYESGSMGWWGMVSDEKDKSEWQNEVAKLMESLSPDTWLVNIDCHI